MSLRQLRPCVDPEFLSLPQPKPQNASKLPALHGGERKKQPWEPVKDTGVQPGQQQHTQQLTKSTPPLPTGLPKDQVFSGSYAALRCQPGSPAVRALVLQQGLAVADLAFKDLLDTNYPHNSRSRTLPPRLQRHRFVRKIITPTGALQTDMSHFSNFEPPPAKQPPPPAKEPPAADDQKPDTAKKEPEQQGVDCIHHTVVDAPVNIEVSRNFKPVEMHAKDLSEWDQKATEPFSCSKDARYFVITPEKLSIEASRFVRLAADTYARCSLGRLSPAVASPMFPDAPSVLLTGARQEPSASTPLQSKPSAPKPSAVMQESLKRSLAQAHSQLAHAPSVEKPASQPQATTAGAAGTSHTAGSLVSADAQGAMVQGSQQAQAPEVSCLKHDPSKTPVLNTQTIPSAEAYMPQYGPKASGAGSLPHTEGGEEKPKAASEPATKAQNATDSETSVPSDARLWYHQAVTKMSYQLQRQLLVDSRHSAPFTRSLRSKQEKPCVVVYVVVPSNSAAEVLHALHVVAQALAPCSSLGLAEIAAQLQEGTCVTPDHGNSSTGVKLEQGTEKSAQERYGTARQGRPHSGTIAREWPSILSATPPNPTSIVLQAITCSMLFDTSPHAVRSMAFSVYSKAAGCQLAGPTPTTTPAAMAAIAPVADASQAALDSGAKRESTTAGKGAEAAQQVGPANKSTVGTASTQQKDQPALIAWAGCAAGPQAFRVAEHQQSCTLASDAAEPAAAPDLGKVLRNTDATGIAANGSKPGSDTDKLRTPQRSKSGRSSMGDRRRSVSPHRCTEPPRRSSSSHSKLPFSDTSSSPYSGRSSPGPDGTSDKPNKAQHDASSGKERNPPVPPTGQEKRASNPQQAPAHTAHDREHDASTQHEQQPIGWHATTVLHCTYAMRICNPERLLVSMAWADCRGDMLQHVAEEVPYACDGSENEAASTRAWLCAQVLLQHSAKLLFQPEGSKFEHLCVTLMPVSECEQWIWMHVPQLLEAVALHGCVLPKRITNICVAKAAVDNPVKHTQYMWWPNVARDSCMCVSCPAVRPMFLKHVESTPMRTFRQWNTWSTRADSPSAGEARPHELSTDPPTQHTTPAATPHGTPGALPPTASPAPDEPAKSPRAMSPGMNGTVPTSEKVPAAEKPRTDRLQSPFPGVPLRSPPSRPAIKYINQEPLSSGQMPDSEPHMASNGRHTSVNLTPAKESDEAHRASHQNGVAADDAAAQPGPSHTRSMLGKRSREPSMGPGRRQEPKKKAQEERSTKLQDSRQQWGASATVMWRTPWYTSELLVPGGETLRLLHVAMLCQWRVQLATEPDTEKCQDGAAGTSSHGMADNADEQKRHYHVQWLNSTDDCAAASALALHQLALLHRCHWEISLQETLGDIVFEEPRCAHWPIHCALAARGCLLSDMLQC